jgi:hypothetical protein
LRQLRSAGRLDGWSLRSSLLSLSRRLLLLRWRRLLRVGAEYRR